MVTECHQYVLFVALLIFTKPSRKRLPNFFGTEDTILYAAAFDANGGVFEPLLTEEDAIISDSLNHASIIDGVRLCKATTLPLS